ncbi:MAG: hypothetical protein VW519_08900 [Luminiphilus sp.]
MKKAVIEESILKHLKRGHKTNIEEELMKARAYVTALAAYQDSELAQSDPEAASLRGGRESRHHLANAFWPTSNSARSRLRQL